VTAAAVASLSSCDSGIGNGRPNLTAIPAQTATGGTTFTLDLANYVTDPEGSTIVYAVTSGGGSFAGSVYSKMFPALGTYEVKATATDAANKSVDIRFTVTVTQTTLVVIQAGDNLVLLDDGSADTFTTIDPITGYTESFLEVTNAQGLPDTFKAGLPRGGLVYQRTVSSQKDLYVYDPSSRTTRQLGTDPLQQTDEEYVAKTSKDHVIFTTGSASDRNLYIYNAVTGFTREISAVPNQHDRNAFVTATDEVYYARGAGGQADIYEYDIDTDGSTAISTNAANEAILAVLPNGGLVFSRVGGTNETDIYYYQNGVGVVEVGADLGATIQDETKTYNAFTNDSRVIFTHDAGSDTNIYVWNPSTLTTATVANSSDNETYRAVTANNKIVYTRSVGGTQDDPYLYDVAGATGAAMSTDAANEIFQAGTTLGDVVFLRENGGGDGLYLWDDSAATLRTVAATGGGDYTFEKALAGGNVAYSHGTGVFRYDATALSNATVGGATYSFGGETSGGDFVVSNTVAAQEDLALWDETTDALISISSDADNDSFAVNLTDDRVLFFRNVSAAANKSLFVWDEGTTTSARISDVAVDQTVVTTYFADNP
jgi:hypothetical protein